MDEIELKKQNQSSLWLQSKQFSLKERQKDKRQTLAGVSILGCSHVGENKITEDVQKTIFLLIFRICCNIMQLCENIQKCC